ncbi:Bug family tripartite tricarboxylate transporter substrate binding protein [Xanthomonas axonopodis]|uniref:Bug family tripartite tricarboxylate transporter substrate binding protein n=1 Tax=Xanthomonas axonopodis TaxID=53413 RepID=UPI003558DCC9
MLNRRELLAAGTALVASMLPYGVFAQPAWPSQPVRIVVPYVPGGTNDLVARRVGQRMSELLGQPVVIENRPGGNSSIGAEHVARAAPDGYTLLLTNDATFIANPLVLRNLPYDVQRDFVPVATVAYVSLVLVVAADAPYRSMAELAERIRNRKDLAYGSFGVGSQSHLMGEMLNRLAGANLIHVPYKGAAQAVGGVMGHQIVLTFPAFPSVQGHVASGKLRVLAVSGERRMPQIPEVPTFREAGFKDLDMGAWYALLAPAATPSAVVDKINTTIATILADQEFVEKNLIGLQPMVSTPQRFAAMIQSGTAETAEYIKRSGARID